MKKLGVLVLALLVPVVAYAAEVSVDTPKPLFCGSGLVKISGLARVQSGEPYTVLKVFFGPVGGSQPQVYTATLAADSTHHDWVTHVVVTQGTNYSIIGGLYTTGGTQGTQVAVSKPSEACSAHDLGLLVDDAASRLLTLL